MLLRVTYIHVKVSDITKQLNFFFPVFLTIGNGSTFIFFLLQKFFFLLDIFEHRKEHEIYRSCLKNNDMPAKL